MLKPFQLCDDLVAELGLEMGHQNRNGWLSEFVDLLGQHSRCEMSAHFGNILQPVGKGSLQHHRAEVLSPPSHQPDLFRGPGVSYNQ